MRMKSRGEENIAAEAWLKPRQSPYFEEMK